MRKGVFQVEERKSKDDDEKSKVYLRNSDLSWSIPEETAGDMLQEQDETGAQQALDTSLGIETHQVALTSLDTKSMDS